MNVYSHAFEGPESTSTRVFFCEAQTREGAATSL